MNVTHDDEFFAPRMHRFRASPSQLAAVRVRELIAQGRDIVKLTTGEPDFPAPTVATEAAIACIRQNEIRYTPVNGTVEMRQAIQNKFRRDNKLDYTLDQIAVGSGTKQVVFNALMSTLRTGDEVIIPAPYWTSYPDMVKLAGGTPVIVPCPEPSAFKLQPAQLSNAISTNTKWLILNSPGNPTGATYTRAELVALAEVLVQHPHVHILCDDVYEHLMFDGHEFATLAEVDRRLIDRCIVCNGVSKAYSMTGWRVGFAAGPANIISQMSKMQSQSSAGISAVSQAAAAAALNGPLDYVVERTADLQRRRDLLLSALSGIDGLHCPVPTGAMYIYCGCDGLIGKTCPDGTRINSDTDVVMYLLDAVGVALVQGEAYGMSPCFRASFVASDDNLRRGAERIGQAVTALQ